MDEPNLTHVENLGQGKLVPISLSWPEGFPSKLCHPGGHMRRASVWTQPKYKVLGPDLMNWAIVLGQIFRVGAGPKYKVALIYATAKYRWWRWGRLFRCHGDVLRVFIWGTGLCRSPKYEFGRWMNVAFRKYCQMKMWPITSAFLSNQDAWWST
jgi:hypothetical protein